MLITCHFSFLVREADVAGLGRNPIALLASDQNEQLVSREIRQRELSSNDDSS
jgi:hypothetical protein